MAGSNNAPDPADVRRLLEEVPGLGDADLSAFPDAISLTLDSAAVDEAVAVAVHNWLHAAAGVEAEIVVVAPKKAERFGDRRSRLESIEVSQPEPGRFTARVTLEWDEEVWEGRAEGVWNPASELRVSGLAALRAVEKTLDGAASFSLVGVKELQVFDHSMVVVLVNCPQLSESRLIGTALIVESRFRAAAAAALNATNRVVGRFVAS